jgi:hypothetical protein
MTVTLKSLELSPERLEALREFIGKAAYFKWVHAGRPPGDGFEFWLEAEREYLERCYVPSRPLDGSRPPMGRSNTPEIPPAAQSRGNDRPRCLAIDEPTRTARKQRRRAGKTVAAAETCTGR